MRHLAFLSPFLALIVCLTLSGAAALAAGTEHSNPLTAQEYIAAILRLPDAQGAPLRSRVKPAGTRDNFGSLSQEEAGIVTRQLAAVHRAAIPVETVRQWVATYDAGRPHNNIFRRLASLATRPELTGCLHDITGSKDALGHSVSPQRAFRYCAAGARPGEITAQSLDGRALVILSYSDFNGALEVEQFANLFSDIRQSYPLAFVLADTPADVQAAVAKHLDGPRIIAGHPARGGIELTRTSRNGILSSAAAQALVEHLHGEPIVVYACRGGQFFAPALAAGGAHVIGSTGRFTAAEVKVTGAYPLRMEFHPRGNNATYESLQAPGASGLPTPQLSGGR
ncbi:MAG: hypothetical protein HYX74_08540 [Acidobacteria bacterium]|nr:hypothetical protein [Acidobacteriota bacterium]